MRTILIVAVVLLGATLPAIWTLSGGSQTPGPASPDPPAAVTLPPLPPSPPTITLEKYRQIRNGMSYNEVVEIFGEQETESYSEYDEGIKGYTGPSLTSWFIWRNPDGSAAEIAFISNKVVGKKQEGLISAAHAVQDGALVL